MSTDNETVEQVCESVEYLCGTDGGGLEIFGEHINPISLSERILSAHKREMNALAAQKTAEAHEAFCKNAELGDAIMAKDRQLEAASADAEAADAEIDSLRNKLASKDAEIASLRLLVGELADALLAACDDTCDYCKKHLNFSEATASICLHNRQCSVGQAYGRLVAKAREVVK